jgi:hypothetical protein
MNIQRTSVLTLRSSFQLPEPANDPNILLSLFPPRLLSISFPLNSNQLSPADVHLGGKELGAPRIASHAGKESSASGMHARNEIYLVRLGVVCS